MRQEAKTRTGAAAATQAADLQTKSQRGRIASIDILRGLVIALMALDHARDFFGGGDFNPRDVTEPALFLTRWITHLCAPTFVLLAGMSAFLYGRGRTRGELSRFLLTRGIWLILIEFTLVNFAWSFEFAIPLRLYAGVIFVIGASMLCLAALIHLPRAAIATIAIMLIAGHNLFDGVRAEELGVGAALWHFLHDPGRIDLGGGGTFYTLYTLIPWVGVMAAGYALGPIMTLAPEARRRTLLSLGIALLVGFVLLRASNLYGDPAPWQAQESLRGDAARLPQLRKISAILAVLADDVGAGLAAAGCVRECPRAVGGMALSIRRGAVLLLRDPSLCAAWRSGARRCRSQRDVRSGAAAGREPAHDLRDLARRASLTLSALPHGSRG